MNETIGVVSNIQLIGNNESKTRTVKNLTIDIMLNGEVISLENYIYDGEISFGDVVRVNGIKIKKMIPEEKLTSYEVDTLTALNKYYLNAMEIFSLFLEISVSAKDLKIVLSKIKISLLKKFLSGEKLKYFENLLSERKTKNMNDLKEMLHVKDKLTTILGKINEIMKNNNKVLCFSE